MTRLSHLLANAAAIIATARQRDGSFHFDSERAELLVLSLKNAASAAHHLEQMAGITDVVAFAKSGEPRPSAEILDLSEILGREKVSRITSEAGPELAENAKNSGSAQFYVFPTVPRTPLNGGDAA